MVDVHASTSTIPHNNVCETWGLDLVTQEPLTENPDQQLVHFYDNSLTMATYLTVQIITWFAAQLYATGNLNEYLDYYDVPAQPQTMKLPHNNTPITFLNLIDVLRTDTNFVQLKNASTAEIAAQSMGYMLQIHIAHHLQFCLTSNLITASLTAMAKMANVAEIDMVHAFQTHNRHKDFETIYFLITEDTRLVHTLKTMAVHTAKLTDHLPSNVRELTDPIDPKLANNAVQRALWLANAHWETQPNVYSFYVVATTGHLHLSPVVNTTKYNSDEPTMVGSVFDLSIAKVMACATQVPTTMLFDVLASIGVKYTDIGHVHAVIWPWHRCMLLFTPETKWVILHYNGLDSMAALVQWASQIHPMDEEAHSLEVLEPVQQQVNEFNIELAQPLDVLESARPRQQNKFNNNRANPYIVCAGGLFLGVVLTTLILRYTF